MAEPPDVRWPSAEQAKDKHVFTLWWAQAINDTKQRDLKRYDAVANRILCEQAAG